MKKKILALVLTLAMVLSLLPATALATGKNEGETPSAGSKIYVDANSTKDGDGDGSKENPYKSLVTAVKEATSGDTIILGEGNYTLYGVDSKDTTEGKDLTFIGQGAGETVWNMGTSVAGAPNGGEDGDYSFDGSEKVTFKDMTLRSSVKDGTGDMVTRNNTGFVRIQHIVVDNCIIEGRTTYWGYTDTEFHNTKFYAPGHPELNGILKNNEIDYVLWTGTGTKYTFDTCTFYANTKIVHLYRDYGAGTTTVEINFNDCTVKNTGLALLSKQVLNIKDSNNNYIVNISGTNTVTGVNPNRKTCSRWFQVESVGEGKPHYATVNIDGETVWKEGKMVSHAIDTAHDKYTDGYKDNAFTYSYDDWTKNPDGTKTREVTKTCKYCGYQEKTTENAPADPIEWDVSRSKTATPLNTRDWTSDVTLSLPSAEEELASDVVFVLDTSDCVGAVMDQVSELVTQLKAAQKSSGADIKVGVVAFKGSALSMFGGELVSVKKAEETLTKMIDEVKAVPLKDDKPDKAAQEQAVMKYLDADKNFIYKGSNLHSGLLGAQELLKNDTAVSNTRKYVVTVTDGMTYYWNKGDDVYGVYGGSNEYTPEANLLFYTWCGVHGIDTEGTYTLPETFSWDTYVTSAKVLIAADNGAYDVNIRDAAAKLGKNFNEVRSIADNADLRAQNIPYISRDDRANHAHGIDQSVIACLATYQEMVDSKYKCYVVNPDNYGTGTFPGLFTSELNELANVTGEVNFNTITKDILYAVSAGSTVTDTIGEKFTFGGVDSFTLKVGTEKIEGVKDTSDENTVNFGEKKNDGKYPYTVTYTPNTKTFVWTINENVSNFAPVQLTYTVKLTTPETDPGTYGTEDLKGEKDVPADKALFTNESAVLNAKNSAGAPVKEQEFPKPSVSYTVKGGSGGSHKPTVTIPDDVPTGLNGKDHYAYVVGYPDGMVYPQKNITRAEVATIFFRLLTDETREANMTKSNSYNDMKDGAWYTCAVSTLSKMGIIKGYEDGSFKPDASISRAEFAAIAARFDPDGDKTPATFSDVSSHWAKDEISIAANHGWIKGYEDGSFKPDQKITRAETMTLVNRVLKRLPETKDDLHKDMKTWPDNQNESAWFYLAVQEATNSHYQKLKKDGTHETWESMRETRDWAALEK